MSHLRANVKYMFDTLQAGSGPDISDSLPDDPSVPLERVEAEICELAGHLAAATCRFLVLLGDFDTRRGWASWEARAQNRVTVYEPEDWENRIRRYYDEHPRSLYRVIQAIPG
jgi:hypothetical protein